MSREEMDRLRGRLAREKEEAEIQLNDTAARLRKLAFHLRSAADAISERCDAAKKADNTELPSLRISMDAEPFIDMKTLGVILAEHKLAYDKYISAVAGIARFNF